jgi:superfamily II DNA or RNA helicase
MAWALSYPPRDWQNKAILNWSNNSNRGIAKVVTGGGKTYFAMMCILSFRKVNENVNYLIVVPTLALRDQWLLDIIEGLNVSREEIYCHGIDKKVLDRHRIIIMVINSARTHSQSLTSNGEWMLIVDECHRAASEENRKSLEGDWLATLGLSATPERQYDEWFSEFLIPKLGPIISEYNYKDAKKDNVIVDFELRNYKVPLTDEEKEKQAVLSKKIAIEKSIIAKEGRFESPRLLNLYLQRSRLSQKAEFRIPLALKICQEYLGKRILIFHELIESANQVTRMLDELGFRVAVYHSKISPTQRLINLRQYREGTIDVLVTCKALDEGLNVPNTEVGIIIASTRSHRQRIQRMGRILRTSEGKDIGIIISLYTESDEDSLKKEASELEEVSEIKWFVV